MHRILLAILVACLAGLCLACPNVCEDAIVECHTGYSCVPPATTCTNHPLPNLTPCGAGGVCWNGTCHKCPTTCGDLNQLECYTPWACVPPATECSHRPLPNGTPCSDEGMCIDGTCLATLSTASEKRLAQEREELTQDLLGCPSDCPDAIVECHTGYSCVPPAKTCTNHPLPNLTPCGAGGVCWNGTCHKCESCAERTNMVCYTPWTCAPPATECTHTPLPNGTPCATNGHCVDGSCEKTFAIRRFKVQAAHYEGTALPLGNEKPIAPPAMPAWYRMSLVIALMATIAGVVMYKFSAQRAQQIPYTPVPTDEIVISV